MRRHYLDLGEFLQAKEREFFRNYSKGGKTFCQKVRTIPRFIRAVHGNGQHFQEESLKGFSMYHKAAIQLAAEGDLPRAPLRYWAVTADSRQAGAASVWITSPLLRRLAGASHAGIWMRRERSTA